MDKKFLKILIVVFILIIVLFTAGCNQIYPSPEIRDIQRGFDDYSIIVYARGPLNYGEWGGNISHVIPGTGRIVYDTKYHDDWRDYKSLAYEDHHSQFDCYDYYVIFNDMERKVEYHFRPVITYSQSMRYDIPGPDAVFKLK